MTLQKINGSTDIMALQGTYTPAEVLADIDELLNYINDDTDSKKTK